MHLLLQAGRRARAACPARRSGGTDLASVLRAVKWVDEDQGFVARERHVLMESPA